MKHDSNPGQGQRSYIFDPLDNICHQMSTPGSMIIYNNLHFVRFSSQLTKMGNSGEFLKVHITHSKRYIDGVVAIGIHRGKFNVISDPLNNICHQMSTPGSMR